MEKNITYYKGILPKRITINLVKDKNEIWVKVLELPNCNGVVLDISDLSLIVTKLIYDHFEVNNDYRKELGNYNTIDEIHSVIEEVTTKNLELNLETIEIIMKIKMIMI